VRESLTAKLFFLLRNRMGKSRLGDATSFGRLRERPGVGDGSRKSALLKIHGSSGVLNIAYSSQTHRSENEFFSRLNGFGKGIPFFERQSPNRGNT